MARRCTSRAAIRQVPPETRSDAALWAIAGFTIAAAAFHLLSQSQRHLWADEASTYWTVQARLFDLLNGARTDGTPPLYFLIVWATTRLFGTSELVLRLPSIIAAAALVPASYAVTRLFATRRTAAIAAALAAISPLVHYYAVEARGYALVQLETLAILYATVRAIHAPHQRWRWVVVCLAQIIQLLTHNYALFLFPVPALVALMTAGQRRLAVGGRAALSACVAFAAYLPWFLRAEANAVAGVGDWIRPYWEATPPAAAIVRSLEVFGFGGAYPLYLTYLGIAPHVRILALLLTAGLLLAAVLVPWPSRLQSSSVRSITLLSFLFVPLIAAWLFSWLREPIYYVGRYDTIVLPAFLILFAIGLDAALSLGPWLGAVAAAAVLALAVVSSWPALGPPLDSDVEDVMAAQLLVQQASPSDPVVLTGTRRPVVEYYLARAGHQATLVSFPAEIGDHPGWFSDSKMQREPARLASEGTALADTLATAARQGHEVWVLSSGSSTVDNYLYFPLLRRLSVDQSHTAKDWRVYCLKPTS